MARQKVKITTKRTRSRVHRNGKARKVAKRKLPKPGNTVMG